MLGLVFRHDEETWLVTPEDWEPTTISDYDELYTDLPITKGEIVEVERNETANMTALKSLRCITILDKHTMEEVPMAEIVDKCYRNLSHDHGFTWRETLLGMMEDEGST